MVEPSASTARTPSRRDPEATRQALVEAGAALFAERGYDGVAIEDLAGRAGVNKALISYHFGGKRGLYTAVLVAGFREMVARLRAAEAEERDVPGTLHRLLECFDALRRERPFLPGLFVREVLSSGLEPAVVPYLLEIVGVVRRLAERGARAGVLRPVNPLLLHFGLVGSLVFFLATEPARLRAVAERRIPFAQPDFPSFLRYMEELTLRGLAPAKRRPRRPAARRPAGRRKGTRA